MENELTKEFRNYVDKVYHGETLDQEQYKQIYLAFHAGAVTWFKIMMKVAADYQGDPDSGAVELARLRGILFANCEDFTNQLKSIN